MKLVYFVGIITVFMSLTASAAAPKLRVPRLKTTGAFNKPVTAQTAPEFVEKKNGVTMLRRFYMTRWGVNRYEYGYALYRCPGSRCEMYGDAVSLNFYESCNGFQANGKPNCTRMISTRVDVVDPMEDGNSSNSRRTWYSCEDYGVNCSRNQNEWDEWGSRHDNSNSEWDTGSYSP